MPVGRRRADARRTRGVGESEAGRSLLGNQAKRRLQQRLLQIAVVVAALSAALFLASAHVKGFYMSWRKVTRP
jgi:transcriptional regulator of nitric oxide reductase